jgi:uncharacterized protein (TIGR02653 family)
MTSKTIDSCLDDLLNRHFAGKVVRKDLTKLVKEGANVPVYVLEYLLGLHCASNDDAIINEGMKTVKKILAENYVRPDEAEKVKSIIRERGSLKIIDKATVKLNEKRDVYEALLGNLGTKGVEISTATVQKYEKLLAGGIWSIITMQYFYEEGQKGSPFLIEELKPIQMPNMDMDGLFEGRRGFTEDQWTDVLLRSAGYEPTQFEKRVKWHILARMVPLVENNYNVCELGPRGTGKSHIYKEISPNSILISGGHTTVANLFYNMTSRTVGLVGLWDTVDRDERVPLHPVVVEHLRKIMDFGSLVFFWPHHKRTLYVDFAAIQDAAGIYLPCTAKHEHVDTCHRYGFHDLRRAFATVNAPRLTADALQSLMRHKSYQTTQRYINMAGQLDEAVKVLHVPEVLKQQNEN